MPATVYDIRERSSAFSKPTGKKRPDINVQRILDEVTDAESERDTHVADWRALYNLTMPNRQGFDQQQPGQPRKPQEKFASEPIRAMRRGVGNLIGALTPAEIEWAEIVPGPRVPESRRQSFSKATEAITKRVFTALNSSRFGTEAHSMGYDVMASTGFLRMAIGTPTNPLKVRSFPMHECLPVAGPEGDIENVHRKFKTRVEFLERDYPAIQLTPRLQALKARTPRATVDIIEATYFEADTATFRSCVIDPETKAVMHEGEPEPVSPWITPRLSVTPGNVFGTGFGIDALPDIRVLNRMREATLKAGARNAAPPTLYATQTGLNPHTVRHDPNAVGFIDVIALQGNAPFYQMPAVDPTWPELASDKLIQVIDDILIAQQIVGQTDDLKGVTAFAVSVRRQQVLLERGVDLSRIIREFPMAVIKRATWILSRLGLFEGLNRQVVVDDQLLSLVPKGPLALAQQAEKVNANLAFVSSLRAGLGDQATTLGIKIEDLAAKFAEDQPGFPNDLIRDEEERAQMQQQAAAITAAEMTQQAPSAAPIDLQQPLA